MVPSHLSQSQRGIALITALLVLLLLLSLSLGFALLVSEEQRSNGVDLDHSQAFYAAYGGMEQLNAQLGNLFALKYDPQAADINPLIATPPVIPGIKFYDPTNGPTFSGYEINYNKDGNGNPLATTGSITQGQYAGFQGLITNYSIIVNAQTQNFAETTDTAGTALTNKYGSEVRLVRTLQTVAIPVFQFGIFSQTDLSFFPGPNFSFGGVVATNGDLYLAGGSTLTLNGQTSAYGDVIRDRLANGLTGGTYQSQYPGTVSITTSAGSSSYRNLAYTEGSINGGPSLDGNNNVGGVVCPVAAGGGTPNGTWTTISISDYNSNLRDGAYGCTRGTGAKNLLLPLVSAGATGIDLIKLPPVSENINNCPVFQQRYFTYPLESDCITPAGTNYAMVRIIIADTAQEILALPGIGPATYSIGCPSGLVQCPVPMSPGTKLAVGAETGRAKQAIPWAESEGGTNGGCTVNNTTPPTYGTPAATPCNFGDWFKGGTGAAGTDPLNGWSRLGMGDNFVGPPGLGPYIKIEYQDSSTGGWTDVTLQILQLGTTGRNLSQGTGSVASPLPVGATAAQLASGSGATCYEPQPDAVIRLQRITDVPSNYNKVTNLCGYGATNKYALLSGGSNAMSVDPRDYIPNMLFDPREGNLRDYGPTFASAACPTSGGVTTCLQLAGVVHYVELDVTNLARWFTGAIGTKGAPPANTAGYLVYFSDRRGNQPCTPLANCPATASASGMRKLGNLGWEDFVNPLNGNGSPNNLLDTGEDLQGANMTAPGQPAVHMPLDTYGGVTGFAVSTAAPYTPAAGVPTADLVTAAGIGVSGGPAANNQISLGTSGGGSCTSTAACGKTSTPAGVNMFTLVTVREARVNPPLFFRRALKLTDASAYSLGNCGTGIPCGLTITSENPVYIEGNYNATGGSCSGSPLVCTYTGTEEPSAVLADAVTLLSQNWNDIVSYNTPYNPSRSTAVTTYYRTAILAGKGLSFPVSAVVNPPVGSTPVDYGTDGGVHNFLRYIENWGSANLAYNGSIVSFYFNEQAVGVYKCCTTVYNPPGRGYAFDTNFLTPSLLPPRTPTFRDINTLGFTQLILPNQLY